jgi:RsiW-degrading membrane proteinase PrsW (M82 family)
LIVYNDRLPVLILKSIIYATIALPLGYFLLRQAPRQTSLRAKAKSFTAGMIFIVVCLGAISNNIFDKGSDTPTSAVTVLVFFTIFFLAQLPRGRAAQS